MISVLYVDDESTLLEIAKLYLERKQMFTVDTVTSGSLALEYLDTHTPDIIISDYQMPEMDGIEFLKRVRTRHIDLPFIIFTGKGREEVVVQAFEYGADGYLQKGGNPVAQFVELEQKIRINVQRVKANRDLARSEERYHSLYLMLRRMCDNVPACIWAKDLNNRYIFANKAMCDHLLNAKDTEEPLGKTDMFFAERERAAHPDNPTWHTFGEICRDTDMTVLQEKRAQHFDESGNVKGNRIFLDAFKGPFYDDEGKIIGTVGCGRIVGPHPEHDSGSVP
jgi:CheY-like chemotaxis protein